MTGYTDFTQGLGDICVFTVATASAASPYSDANVNSILPRVIAYAEQRCYRDLDLPEARTSNTATLAANVRSLAIPVGSIPFVVVEAVNVITPAGHTPDQAGASRNALLRVSVDFINHVWPAGTADDDAVPQYWATLDNLTALFAPAPDAAYKVEFLGTGRPAALTSANTATILTTYVPDLFLAAAMVFMAGWMRNFGTQSADPEMAVSWEGQYRTLLESAKAEVALKKSRGFLWTAKSPPPKTVAA